jgi:hypothetical protein
VWKIFVRIFLSVSTWKFLSHYHPPALCSARSLQEECFHGINHPSTNLKKSKIQHLLLSTHLYTLGSHNAEWDISNINMFVWISLSMLPNPRKAWFFFVRTLRRSCANDVEVGLNFSFLNNLWRFCQLSYHLSDELYFQKHHNLLAQFKTAYYSLLQNLLTKFTPTKFTFTKVLL